MILSRIFFFFLRSKSIILNPSLKLFTFHDIPNRRKKINEKKRTSPLSMSAANCCSSVNSLIFRIFAKIPVWQIYSLPFSSLNSVQLGRIARSTKFCENCRVTQNMTHTFYKVGATRSGFTQHLSTRLVL